MELDWNRHMIKLMFSIILLFTTSIANAGLLFCEGKVDAMYVSANGDLVILGTWRNDYTAVCSIGYDRSGVSSEVCKGWMSIAQVAKVTGENVLVRYSDSVASSCATLDRYESAPAPQYMMLPKKK